MSKVPPMNIKEALTICVRSAYNVRANNTARAYSNGMNVFADFLADKGISLTSPIGKITMDAFIEFPGWLSEHGYTKKTINVYMSSVKYFMDWLVIENWIAPNYRDTLRYQTAVSQVYRRREDRLPRTPRQGDVERMLEAVYQMEEESPRYERNIALIEFLTSSGCRNNEAAILKIKDIDMISRSAIVTGKGNKERRIYLSSKAIEALKNYWAVRRNSDPGAPVFARHDRGAGRKTKPITTATIRNIVEDVVMVAGLERGSFTPHYFRHAFAIKMLHETHDLALVQDLLGHASPVATRVYAKIYPDELQERHREVFD